MPITTTKCSNKHAVDTEKLVFRHEFPVKRFCRPDKLRDALCDIFGSDDWLVEASGNNVTIKVGRRVDLEEELRARHVIFNSMGIAQAVSFFQLSEYIRF
ncbi:hypothetical protein ACKRZS_008769 [Fusarium odoratissimum]